MTTQLINTLKCLSGCRLIATIMLFTLPASSFAGDQAAKPNIVFIYADDWGWGDLSCHGSTWVQTPNLDRLAREGTDFQQFNVVSPVCSPSRVGAMTGRFPGRFGINDIIGSKRAGSAQPSWLDPKAPTTPRFLKAAGYRTAHFGKWHMGSGPEMSAYGVDESAVYGGPGPQIDDLHAIGVRAAEFIVANKDHPFYVNVWLHESHLAHDPTPESMAKWKGLGEQKQVYAAVITDGDNAVGQVLAALEQAGVAGNTIVIFSSDNGPESTGTIRRKGSGYEADGENEKGNGFGDYYSVGETGGLRGHKRSLFEGGVSTPFILRWPGHTPAGGKNATTVMTAVDLLPTLCAAAGVTPPVDAKLDGENMLAAFNGSSAARSRPIYWKWLGKKDEPDWWPRLGVREGDWKLVMTDDAKRFELYNPVNDRSESHDVAKEHPDIVARLTKLALAWNAALPTQADPANLRRGKASPTTGEGVGAEVRRNSDPVPGATKRVANRAKAFDRMDTNHDGFLTVEEYKAGMKNAANLDSRFKNFDQNGDGRIGRDEFVNSSGEK